MLIGGVGATRYFFDKGVHALAKEAMDSGRIVGAICLAPVILANAGLLQNRNATVYPIKREDLRKRGARVQTDHLVLDGKLITADGPDAAEGFAAAVAAALAEAKAAAQAPPQASPSPAAGP